MSEKIEDRKLDVKEDKLLYVAKTGGIKISSLGDNWINMLNDKKEVLEARLDEIKTWKNKNVVVELLEIGGKHYYQGIALSPNNKKEDDNMYINISGNKFVTHKGLLDKAHSMGLQSIHTEMIQLSDELVLFKAVSTDKLGRTFVAHGDATKENVGKMIVPHIIRMAETRAVNRSLRFLTNVGEASVDEVNNIFEDKKSKKKEYEDFEEEDLDELSSVEDI